MGAVFCGQCPLLITLRKRRFIIAIAILVMACIGLVYYFFNPSQNALFPHCPIFMLTGFECPGCGSQRAIHALFHLNVEQAIHYNALFVFSLPFVTVLVYTELFPHKCKRLYSMLHRQWLAWAIFAIIIAWWVGRNVFQ